MVKVKICGITNLDDARLACELGADALGFVFHKPSPRCVAPEKALAIIQRLPPFVTKVGVVVNMSLLELKELCDQIPIDVIQLHGDESPEYCRQITAPVLKAFRVDGNFEFEKLQSYQTSGFLLDTLVNQNTFGGSGVAFDWTIARDANRYGRIVLSGGLNSDNVLRGIEMVRPYAVDVSSGVEAIPGKKNPEKMKSFFNEIRKYHAKPNL